MEKYRTNVYDYARKGLANGVNICRESVACTIGAAGRNVIIRQEFYPYYITTRDAFSIIQAIKCQDACEKQAVDMMRDATDSMNKIAKDGRTAMCLITDAILQETEKMGADPLEVEVEINRLLPIIEANINTQQTRQINVKEAGFVAKTASNNERIAKIIADIYEKQGKDCIINHIESSGTHEDYVVYHDGVRFQDTGFLSEAFVHDEEAKKDNRTEKRAVYNNPIILVTKRKVATVDDIDPLISNMKRRGKTDLIIFTDDMDSNVATMLVNTHKAGVINICIIKAPVLWKQYVFEDFAKCVGATIVEDSTGVTFKNLSLDHLGTCGRIVIDRDECILTGIQDIGEHLKDLKTRGDDDSLRRVWWLTAKTATMRLGATNEGELSNLRLAAQDAVYSTQAALQSGIVAGGGVCLRNVANSLSLDTPGANVLFKALRAPMGQIIANANIKEVVWEKIVGNVGINAKDGKYVDMFKEGIIDSSLVVRNSVRQAIKIASIILRTEKLIDIPKKTIEEMQLDILSRQRTPF